MNGAIEAANKNIKKILVKMKNTYKDWHEYLPFALCTYRTSVCISTGATLYSLVYGMEVVFPAKVEIPSLRILSQTELSEVEWAHARYEQLNMIDEKCMTAMCYGQFYQRCAEQAFNEKVRPRVFEEGDLVLKKRNQAMPNPRGKFSPTYEGLYVVKKAFSREALILAAIDGLDFNMPTNLDAIIRYFAWRSLEMHLIFMSKRKKNKTKQKNIYVQNGRSKTRVAYEKGEAKERVQEKT